MSQEIILTEEQKATIKSFWNDCPTPPSIPDIGEKIFNKPNLDTRTPEGKVIREYLSESGFKQKNMPRPPVPQVELTEAMKEFVRNNPEMKILEMARLLFKNPNLTALHKETRVLLEYYREIYPSEEMQEAAGANDIPERDYNPPTSPNGVIRKINKYKITNAIDPEKISGKQKKDLEALINYLHTFRFKLIMNTYENQKDRELFESTFIRYVYDKHDLLEEDVEQYINLAADAVVIVESLRELAKYKKEWENLTDSADADSKKFSMVLMESIQAVKKEYNDCIKRQDALSNSLRTKRSERDNDKRNGSSTLLNLIEMWKSEKDRKEMIEEAKKIKVELGEEIERLSALDRAKALIMGMDRNTVLNG